MRLQQQKSEISILINFGNRFSASILVVYGSRFFYENYLQ